MGMLAIRVVLAQMEGSGRGDLGSYGGSDYTQLRDFLLENPIKVRLASLRIIAKFEICNSRNEIDLGS